MHYKQFTNSMVKAAEETCLDALRQQNQSLLAQLKQRQSKFKGLLNATTLERSSHFAENEPAKSTRSAREKLAHCSKAIDTSYRVKHVDLSGMTLSNGDTVPAKQGVVTDGVASHSGSGKTLTSTPKKYSVPSGRPSGSPHGPYRPSGSPYRPTTTPDRPTITPDRPTLTRDRPTTTPDRPTLTRDRPTTTPDRPTLTQDRPMTTPDRPTLTRDRPMTTPDRPTRPLTETPRSILKHRKIIDDNIHVESKYQHTPTVQRTPHQRHNGLNYSYSNVDESFTGTTYRESLDSRVSLPTYSRATDGSYLEEYPSSHLSDKESFMDDVEKLRRQRLLVDPSNDRQNSRNVSFELPQCPKTVEFESPLVSSDDETSPRLDDNNNNNINNSSSNHSRKSTQKHRPKKPQQKPRLQQSPKASSAWRQTHATRPLLGYDWIAGVLDNQDKSVINASDKFFKRISEFRWQHKEDCTTDEPSVSGTVLLSRPVSPQIQDPGHTCIHGYTVNERLFTEPTNADDDGRAVCNVCLIPRKKPSRTSPSFVRVSIPQSQIVKHAREVKPHRRRSFDPSDSCALSEHCLAGWECSRPSHLPTASGLDLKHATNKVTSQLSMTMAEVEQQLSEHSRAAKLGLRANGVTTARGHLNMTHARNLRRLQLA